MADLELGDALTDAPPEIEPEIKRDFISSLEAEAFDDVIGETCDKTDYVPLLDGDETDPKAKLSDGGHPESHAVVVANGEHGTGEIGVSDPFGSKLDEDVLADLLLPPHAAQIFPSLRDAEHLPDSMSEACLLDFGDTSGFFSPLQRECLIPAEAAQGAFDEGWLTDSYSKTGDTDTQSEDTSEKTTGTFGETPSDDSTNLPFQVTKGDHISDIWQPTAEEQLALSPYNPAEVGDLHTEDLLFDAPVPDSQEVTESQLLPGLADQQLQETGDFQYEESGETAEYLSVDAEKALLDHNTVPQEHLEDLSQEVKSQEESSSPIEPHSPCFVHESGEDLIASEESAAAESEPLGENIEQEQELLASQESPDAQSQEEIPAYTSVFTEEESPDSSEAQIQQEIPADLIQESFSESPASPASQAEEEPPISPAAEAEREPIAAEAEREPIAAEAEREPSAPADLVQEPFSESPASPASQAEEEPPISPEAEIEPLAPADLVQEPFSELASPTCHTELEQPASLAAQAEVEPPVCGAAQAEIEALASSIAETQLEPSASVVEETQLEAATSPVAETQLEPAASVVAETQLEPPAPAVAETQLEPPACPIAETQLEPPTSAVAETQPEAPAPLAEIQVSCKPEVCAEETTLLSEPLPAEKLSPPKTLQQSEEVSSDRGKDEPQQPEHPTEPGKAAVAEPVEARAGSDITAPPNKELPASPEKKIKATTATPPKAAAATPKGKLSVAPSPKKPLFTAPGQAKKPSSPAPAQIAGTTPKRPLGITAKASTPKETKDAKPKSPVKTPEKKTPTPVTTTPRPSVRASPAAPKLGTSLAAGGSTPKPNFTPKRPSSVKNDVKPTDAKKPNLTKSPAESSRLKADTVKTNGVAPTCPAPSRPKATKPAAPRPTTGPSASTDTKKVLAARPAPLSKPSTAPTSKPIAKQPRPATAPDLKNVRSKIGSTDNLKHQPGGGKAKVEKKPVPASTARKPVPPAAPKPAASKAADTKETAQKQSNGKVTNATKPSAGAARPPASSAHKPGSANVQITNKKIDVSKVSAKCGSKPGTKHKTGDSKSEENSKKSEVTKQKPQDSTKENEVEQATPSQNGDLVTPTAVTAADTRENGTEEPLPVDGDNQREIQSFNALIPETSI